MPGEPQQSECSAKATDRRSFFGLCCAAAGAALAGGGLRPEPASSVTQEVWRRWRILPPTWMDPSSRTATPLAVAGDSLASGSGSDSRPTEGGGTVFWENTKTGEICTDWFSAKHGFLPIAIGDVPMLVRQAIERRSAWPICSQPLRYYVRFIARTRQQPRGY